MSPQPFWHDLVTEKSWQILQDLRRRYRFVLIGGWAVYLYTRALKSKDIDIVVDYDVLGRFRDAYPLSKNDRLKKYEIRLEEIDVDVYVPHYSDPGLPAEVVQAGAAEHEGFTVPPIEMLLLLKQKAYRERQGSAKGEKDRLDILSLLSAQTPFNWPAYGRLAERHRPEAPAELETLLKQTMEALPLGLHRHKLAKLKRVWLAHLTTPTDSQKAPGTF